MNTKSQMYQSNVRDTEEDHLATLEGISLDGGGLRADAGILELGSVLDVAELACRSVGDAAVGAEGQLALGEGCDYVDVPEGMVSPT